MFSFSIDPFSFFIGFFTGIAFLWLMGRARPLWDEMRAGMKEQQEAAQARKTSSVEENHRRSTLRRAQGMHLAAPLFALDEILQEPLLIAPPPIVEPGVTPKFEDIISQTIPYLPLWPEIAAAYNSASLTLPEALTGGNSNIVIIGQPGTGKTVALAHLASLAANRNDKLEKYKETIPFLVHVADLRLPIGDPKDALNPIIDASAEHVPLLDVRRVPPMVQAAFKNGALLLVDGYDEIGQEQQQQISEYFKLIIKTFPKTRIIATGAPEYLDGLIALGFAPLTLMTWPIWKSQQFIDKWGDLWSQNVTREVWMQDAPEQVDPLLLNVWLGSDNLNLSPLEITLKTWGAYAGDSLGSNVLDAIATHIRRLAPINVPIAALETLAMQVTISGQPIFDPRKAREWVKAFDIEEKTEGEANVEGQEQAEAEKEAETSSKKKKKKSEKVIAVPSSGLLGKLSSSGLLAAYPDNRMRFSHPVLTGYLAGRALVTYNAEETILNQKDWSGKYLSLRYLAAFGDVSKVISAMMEFSRIPTHRPLFAAARWLRDAPKNAAWRGKLFGALAGVMQTDGIPLNLRGQAMAAFVVSGDSNAATLFRQFSSMLSFELVQLVVLGSGAMKDPKSVPVLEEALQAPSLSVRRAACMALVSIGTNEALEAVAHTLLNGDEDIRRAAAEALANDVKEGQAMLRDGITMDDILLRRAVIYGLSRVNEPWAKEALEKAQVEDDQWVVRNAATEVLDSKTVEGSRAPRKLKAPSESPWLIEFAAKNGTGISPGAPATDVLLLALKGENPEFRLAALPYLKFTPSEGVIGQLYDAMYRDDPELREAAYNIIWELGTSGVKLPHPNQFGLG